MVSAKVVCVRVMHNNDNYLKMLETDGEFNLNDEVDFYKIVGGNETKIGNGVIKEFRGNGQSTCKSSSKKFTYETVVVSTEQDLWIPETVVMRKE